MESVEGIALRAESIHRRGLIQPITVFADVDGGATIMAGERRFWRMFCSVERRFAHR